MNGPNLLGKQTLVSHAVEALAMTELEPRCVQGFWVRKTDTGWENSGTLTLLQAL